MSVAKHYTEWSKEDKDALARQRMEEMMKKNEEIRRRYAEVEADRKKAEQQNSSVTLVIRGRSPPGDESNKFDDPSRNRGGGCEICHEDPKRNFANYRSRDFRGTRPGMASRRPQEKEFSRGSNMSQGDDYEKWKAERKKIDEERIARHKVKCEWDEDKVEQEPPEQKQLPSKFYREPSWASKQDDQPQRRDFSQRGYSHGNDRTRFKNTRQNYESDWHDKSSKPFGRSRNNDFSSSDRQSRTSLSDDEDNLSHGRQQKFGSPNNYSSGFRRNQDGSNNYNFRARGRGGSFFHRSRNENKSTYNAPDNCFDTKNDNEDTSYKNRFQDSDYARSKPRAKQNSGTWSDDEGSAYTKTNTQPATQKNSSSGMKQSSGSWSDDGNSDDNTKTSSRGPSHKSNSFVTPRTKVVNTWADDDDNKGPRKKTQSCGQKDDNSLSKPKQRSGTWSDDESPANIKGSFSKIKQTSGTWSDEDSLANHKSSFSKPKQSSDTWSDDDSSANVKTSVKTSQQRDNSSFSKFNSKLTGGGWSEGNGNTKTKSFQKNNFTAETKHSRTWSDDAGGDNVKTTTQLSAQTRSSTVDFEDHVSSGTWSDVDDDLAGKSKNDDAWLDSTNKNESFSADFHKKSGKLSGGKQPSKSFPAGLGRKWSFEPTRQYNANARNISCDNEDDLKNENRAIKVGKDDSLTVTVRNLSSDVKGRRFSSQMPIRNETGYKNTERISGILGRSLSDADKHEMKHNASDYRKRFDDDIHGCQQNARPFRSRGGGLSRSNFGRNNFQKNNYEDTTTQKQSNWCKSSQKGEYSSGSEERSHNKYRDSSWNDDRGGRGSFQHGRSIGARRFEETRSFSKNREIQKSNKSWHNEEPVEGNKGDFAVTVHAEDIWGDVENSGNADLDKEWATDNKGYYPKLKEQIGDGCITEDANSIPHHASERQLGDGGWKSGDFNHSQVSTEVNQSENVKNSDQSPHDHISNPESACDESHDDGSWVTTSGDEVEEELGEGEYIDDDESLHISSVQHYDGDDTSSPEPNIPAFVCSMTEYLISKAANACNNDLRNETEIDQVHDTSELKTVVDGESCSSVHKPEGSEKTGLISHTSSFECSDLQKNKSSREILFPLQSDSNDTDTEKCQNNDQELFIGSNNECGNKGVNTEVSEINNCENAQHFFSDINGHKTIPEVQLSSELSLASGDHLPFLADESSQSVSISHLESCCVATGKLEEQNICSTSISGGHLENDSMSTCSELLHNRSIDNNMSDIKCCSDNMHQNAWAKDDSQSPVESLLSETVSFPDPMCSSTSEEFNKNCSLQNICASQNSDDKSVCITSRNFTNSSADDNYRLTDKSSKESNSSKQTHDKQEEEKVSEIQHCGTLASEMNICDKAVIGNGTFLTVQQTENIIQSGTVAPLNDVDLNENVPVEHSCVTANTEEKNL